MATKAVDIRRGQVLNHEGELWIVHDNQIVAKGNKGSYMKLKLKHFRNGNVVDFRLNVNDRVETPFVEDQTFEYLYREGSDFVVMNTESFDQLHISADLMPEAEKFLKGNEQLACKLLDGEIVGVELPNTVELEVVDAPPVVKGATATNQNKEVTMETGYKVRVPPFISTGEMLKIDTRTGDYISRV
ncbi:MAG: elongation factor P [Phycisphaerales bacterium]|nr:elongation factor P [Phycisphaerales bacterium]